MGALVADGQASAGSLIRSMDHEFREVRFFFTAAVTVTPGRAHESISPLVTCSLGMPSPRGKSRLTVPWMDGGVR